MGGNPLGCPIGDPAPHSCPGGGFSNGQSAESLMAAGMFQGVITTQWTRGRAEQVSRNDIIYVHKCLCIKPMISKVTFKIVGMLINSLFGWVALYSVGRLVGGSSPTMAADTATDSARKARISLRSASK